jgi:hypothetical protein
MTGKRNHGTVLSFSDVESADQAMHGQFFLFFFAVLWNQFGIYLIDFLCTFMVRFVNVLIEKRTGAKYHDRLVLFYRFLSIWIDR